MTGFSSLDVALQGLTTAQRGMDIAGQNVVNANTPGYSRQQMAVSSVGAVTTATLQTGINTFFGGVSVDGVDRVRDAFIEGSRAAAGSRMSALDAQTSVLSSAEQLLSEPSDTGLQSTLDDFYSAWQDLGTSPTDTGTAATVLQRGAEVASQLKYVASGVDTQWQSSYLNLSNVVTQTNQAASDLAKVNESIREGTVVGRPVNELLDQRDTLVRKLGELVGATAQPDEDGMVTVNVNGINLVSRNNAQTFTLSGGTSLGQVTTTPPAISWHGSPVPVESGQAAGLMSVLGSDLPDMSSKLNGVAVAIRDSVNSVHSTGFTLAGGAGGDFYSGTDATNLTVVPTDVSQLAISGSAGTVDGSNAQKLGDLSDDAASALALGGTDGPLAQWRTLSTGLGVKVQGLQRASTIQQSVVQTAESASEADSGVNMDEEMTNMIQWQRAYQASAKVITTVDSMYDALMNTIR